MKCLCITGTQPDLLQNLLLQLEPAGLALPLPLQRDPNFTFSYWHEEIEKLRRDGSRPNQTPGRLWDQLATELFMVNMERPLWGWAEARSLDMLDYWRKFEARLMFLLVYQSPDVALAEFMESEAPEEELSAYLAAWHAQHKILLAFHKRHAKRCLLVRADEALAHPSELATLLKNWLRVPVEPDAVSEAITKKVSPIGLYLATQILSEYPAVMELGREFELVAAPLVESLKALEGKEVTPLLANYRQLRDRSAEKNKITLLQEQYARLNVYLQQTIGNYQTKYREFQACTEKYKEELKSLKVTLGDVQQQLGSQNKQLDKQARVYSRQKELQEENELLLTQLHQVQEELGVSLVKNEDMRKDSIAKEAELRTLQAQLSQAIKLRDDQERLVKEKEIQAATLIGERDIQIKLVRDTKRQLDAAIIEHNKQSKLAKEFKQKMVVISKECDAKARLFEECQAKINALTKAQHELTTQASERQRLADELANARDDQQKLLDEYKRQTEKQNREIVDLQTQLKAFNGTKPSQDLKDLDRRLKAANEENELLLLQLHQVQEELEHYFLQFQEQQQATKRTERRLHRVLECFPDYLESPVVEAAENSSGHAVWTMHDLVLAGKDFELFQFVTTLEEDGSVTLKFDVEPYGRRLFTRWRALAGESKVLLLKSAGVLLPSLGVSDYKRVASLADILFKVTQEPDNIKSPGSFDTRKWQRGIVDFRAALRKQSGVLRCEALRLKNEQVNPDYEHLWIVCEDLALGESQWPKFEFRLSCAHVKPNSFGEFPKLEFPQDNGREPFDKWYVEAHDDHGPKLELRYNLPHGLDEAVWKRLSTNDRFFVIALIQQTSYWLLQLEREGLILQRPWKDWQRMLQGMLQITRSLHQNESGDKPNFIGSSEAGTNKNIKSDSSSPLNILLDSIPHADVVHGTTVKAYSLGRQPTKAVAKSASPKRLRGGRKVK